MTPTLPASRGSLPPEWALRLWPGKAGSTAPAGVEIKLLRFLLRVVDYGERCETHST